MQKAVAEQEPEGRRRAVCRRYGHRRKSGNVALTVSTALYPEVTLGEYKGIEVAEEGRVRR